MLAIDCLVGGLLLSSIGVNILALGAFWVTPSLRTTANRFVINLLIVNLVCCIILGPSLLLNAFTGKAAVPTPLPTAELPAAAATPILYEPTTGGEYGSPAYTTTTVALAYQQPSSTVAQPNRTRIVRCSKNGTMGSGDDGPSNCDRQEEQNDEDEEETPFIRTSRIHPGPGVDALHPNLTLTKIRCWGLDLVVALGALSVLLVVGDTWCAITDPLRYHSRISELKAWAFIIASWALGIAFGIASGFRGDQKYVTLFKNRLTAEEHLNISEDLYNTIFSYAYFVIVILIPFALVCAMYWRIFSEARESGQRMRQNGSSPLLQSALNLVSAQKQCHAADKQSMLEQQQQPTQQLHQPIQPMPSIPERPGESRGDCCDGLTMKIDKQIHYEDETITISSIPHHHQPRDSCLKPLLQQSPAPTPTHKPIQQHQPLDASLERADRSPQVVQIATPTSGVAASLPSVLKSPLRPDRNHNSILMHQQLPAESSASGPIPTHSSPPPAASAGLGKVRRNHSAGRLVSFCQEEPTELPVAGLRQVHSTPNFQKYSGGEFESLGTHHILSLPAVHVPPKALSYMTSIRHRLSNASSLFKYREESRAARISILVIIMVLVSGAGGLTRSNSSCKYLTPNHAAAVAVANGYIVEFERYPSDELNSLCIQKKSILKRVCDSSRKWGCNFATNSCTSNDEQTEV
uniref:G-protein coupled receptors family 1 profile domain-containing protein n=1 Tax=Anopheles coluzzii TaxID=1518534 RepID=A0A8W7PSG5_ANOCL